MAVVMDNQRINRRQFLGRASLCAAGVGLESLAGDLRGAPVRSRRHVVIIGAGLAGLCAAYELEQRGHRVTLLEAEPSYIGGRVRTISFGSGLYGEAGAMRIPAAHRLVRRYVTQFGLPLRKFVEFNPDAFYYTGGRRQRIRSAGSLDSRYAMQGGGGGPGSIWSERFDEIVGGMDRLPQAFLQRLRSAPRRGCRALKIEQHFLQKRAAVVFEEHGRLRSVGGDCVLCTLPLPVLERLEFAPELPESRQRDIRRLHYGSASKTLLVTRRRFWESDDGIYGGASYTDLPSGSVYYPSDNAHRRDPHVSAAPGVLLASYTLDRAAKKMAALPRTRCSAWVRELDSPLHPQLREAGMVVSSTSWSWDDHPFSRGAFAAPGQDHDLVRRIRAPEGRLYFAGEHTSSHPTWMEGALGSALRAVAEILHA